MHKRKFSITRTKPATRSACRPRRCRRASFATRCSRAISVAAKAKQTSVFSSSVTGEPAAICARRSGAISTPTPAKRRLSRRVCLRLGSLSPTRIRCARIPGPSPHGPDGMLAIHHDASSERTAAAPSYPNASVFPVCCGQPAPLSRSRRYSTLPAAGFLQWSRTLPQNQDWRWVVVTDADKRAATVRGRGFGLGVDHPGCPELSARAALAWPRVGGPACTWPGNVKSPICSGFRTR